MVYLDSNKIMECVEWETITNDTVTFNVDGEKLRQAIYEDLKITIDDSDSEYEIKLIFQDVPFIRLHPNEVFTERDCKQFAVEMSNILTNRIKSKLNME